MLALALWAAPIRAGEPTFTQAFNLVPGWNAIYLHLQPQDTTPAVVFGSLPVVSVWTRGVEPGGPEFIENPNEVLRPELRPRGWLVYVPAGQPDSFLSTLASIQGNRAFLIHLSGGPSVLQVSGRPLVPIINWQPGAFNLVGFPIDPSAPPTFERYFAPSDALRDQPIYRLLPTGLWERIGVPDVERMRFGEAYQVYAGAGTDFIAPLALQVPTSDGLAYGRSVTEHTLRMTNSHDAAITVDLEALAAPDTVPLSHFQVRTTPPGAGTFEWPPLPSPLQIQVDAGVVRSTRLAVRRRDFSADRLGTVVSIRDGLGTRWLLPLTADKVDTTSPGLAGQSALSGLWVGSVTINRVSQPNGATPDAPPVAAVAGDNVCHGGPNVGQRCDDDGDCLVFCSLHCGGGINDGDACTPAMQAQDCPGSTCPAPPKRCVGGVNAGLRCGADMDCPGSKCSDLRDRCKGGSREGALCDAGEANDCPNGVCGEVLRCADDTQVECTPDTADAVCPGSTCEPMQLCTSGDNLGSPCAAHDCSAGTCETPDDTCLGGSNANQSCSTDADCPGSRCNALSRCIGGPKDSQACTTHADCGSSSCAPPSGRASEFPLRLMLHVDGGGTVRLLKQVIQMWQNGTTQRDADDPDTRILDRPGHVVLLTDDELIPSFQGATLRDGIPVGRRLSTAAFDFAGNDLMMSGGFGCDAGTLTASITLDRNFPTNPYRHPFHPDHDNLSGRGAGMICRGGSEAGDTCAGDADCPGGTCAEVEEAFDITREITLAFASSKTCSGGDNAGAACASTADCQGGTCETDVTRPPETCVDEIEGEYRETIRGLHRNAIHVAGAFRLERAALTPTLNPPPQ